ncbi:two-component regulator propeller domain-containing protein [Danxiaibacter flavus]|uniref:Two-component regulator propeller domain-containing protein n=1 Tax=Danxiaibacter flavus TaxID=3049108 RepID=A0ABV3ZKC6_9BACT|nr:two-component regulator propeller domain-containing protein [Chitinophagaceae bacterium DXS]
MNRLIPWKNTLLKAAFLKAAAVLFWGIAPSPCLAQPALNNIRFNHFSQDHMLSQTIFTSILQDKKGYMWFGAYNGLIKFDGYAFTSFRYDPYNKNTLPLNDVTSLCEDSNRSIWMTGNKGLCKYNTQTEKFTFYDQNKIAPTPANGNCLAVDKNGRVWIGTNTGVYFYESFSDKFVNLNSLIGNDSLIGQNVICLMISRENMLWIGTSNGINIFDPARKKLTRFLPPAKAHESLGREVICMLQDHENNIWISLWNKGLFRYNAQTKVAKVFRHSNANFNSLGSDAVNALIEDSRHRIWAGTYTGGVSIYRHETEDFQTFHADGSDKYSLTSDEVKYLYEDRSGVLWIATAGGGLNNCYISEKKFSLFQNYDKAYASHFPLGMYKDRKGRIFMTTFGVGVQEFSAVSESFKGYKIAMRNNAITGFNFCYGMECDSDGIYWVVSFDEGLLMLDRATGKLLPVHSTFNNKDTTLHNQCNSIVEDNDKKLWIGTEHGLKYYDLRTKQFLSFENFHRDTNHLSTDNIAGLHFDSDGILWVTGTNGITMLNTTSGVIKIFSHDDQNANSICNNITHCFYDDGQGIIWIGTQGGLSRFEKKTESFVSFTTRDGLPDNSIIGIVADDDCNLWLTTNRGLCRFTPCIGRSPQSICRNYDINDGLPGDEFNFNACVKGDDGRLYFGCNVGLLAFRPGELKDNTYIPPVVITGINISNRSFDSGDSINIITSPVDEIDHLKLSYRQNDISFVFAALSYVHPEKNRFAYMLEGYDKNWIFTDAAKRLANYTNLDAGSYTFKVKASNNDNMWNEVPAVITFTIAPPFWNTWWFKALLVALVVVALYAVYRYRVQQVIKLQTIRNNIASDLHDDIGSTLNSISVLSEVAKLQAGKSLPALDEIGESSRKIVDAMSDIVWTINPENDDFEKIVSRMRSFAYQVLKGKNIQFNFLIEGDISGISMPMEVRKNFYLIFKEATTNVVKYSQASHIRFLISRNESLVYMLIRDNGVGFNRDKLDAGNGLKNMQRRAKEINAILIIETATEEGTSIELKLKI